MTHQIHLRRRELQTTERELRAMAAAAIQGARFTPMGTKTPAAIGIPVTKMTYIHVHTYKHTYIHVHISQYQRVTPNVKINNA